jgi:hypothetical protein
MRSSVRWAGVIGHDVLNVWPRVEVFIKEAIERGHVPYSLEEVAAEIMERRWQLWTVMDDDGIMAVAVTKIDKFGNGTVGTIMFLSGEEWGKWAHLLNDVLMPWFKEKGCQSVRLFGRKGFQRLLPDWETVAYVMTRDL